VLLHLRAKAVEAGVDRREAAARAAAGAALGGARRFALAQRLARLLQRPFVRRGRISRLPPPLAGWTRSRDLAPVARQSFREWWKERS
jgi:L-lactate dehydrogenase complex protein LldF